MKYIKQSLLLLTIATSCGSFLHAGKLHDLIEKGDVKQVEQFLNDNKGIDIDEEDSINNKTPLITACYYGNPEIVKILISHGADVNKPRINNDTPLMEAIDYEYIEIVKLLLSHGADVNKPGHNNYTPLHKACSKKNIEIIKLLLSYGVDVNKTSCNNYTPLQSACLDGNIEIVKLLLSHGADVNKPGINNDTPLTTACYYGYIEIIKLLFSYGADVDKPGNYNDTPLRRSCYYEYIEIVKILLLNGADVNKPGYKNQTPFEIIKTWSPEKQNQLFKDFFIIKETIKKTETKQDVNTRLFIEFNAADHADSFNQNKTLVPFIITDKQRNDLLLAGGFKEVKNKELIISIGEEFLNNLFFRFEKNKNNTLPVFISKQPKTALNPYVNQLKIQKDFHVFKYHNIKSYDDLSYKIKLLAFAQKSWKKWNKKQKSKVQFEDVTLNFKSDNSDS